MPTPTMTLKECAAAMRERNVPCTETGIANAIEDGAYPFGRIKHVGKTGRRSIEIWRVDFERWLAERTGNLN